MVADRIGTEWPRAGPNGSSRGSFADLDAIVYGPF